MVPNVYIGRKTELSYDVKLYASFIAMWEFDVSQNKPIWCVTKNRLDGRVGVITEQAIAHYQLKLIQNWAELPLPVTVA